MKINIVSYVVVFVVSLIISSLLSCKKDCKSSDIETSPFVQRLYYCNDGIEHTYILRRQEDVESLEPNCYFPNSSIFPLDDTDMVYIIFGKMSYFHKDSFTTKLVRNTCQKTLTYEVKMIQRTKTELGEFAWPKYIFCSVDSTPEDYDVIIDYEYVPLE